MGAPNAQTSDHASSRAASGRGGTRENEKSPSSEDQRSQDFTDEAGRKPSWCAGGVLMVK